jgi:hypothetical protein
MPTYQGLSYFVYTAMEGMLRACNVTKAILFYFIALRLLAHSSSSYSQSKVPFFHSYINLIVKINKKTIIDQNPNKPILLKKLPKEIKGDFQIKYKK